MDINTKDHLLFAQIKTIKQSVQDIIYGYIRNIEKINNDYNNIPELIVFLCLAFYHQFDVFEKYSRNYTISGDERNIITKSGKGYTWKGVAYCSH